MINNYEFVIPPDYNDSFRQFQGAAFEKWHFVFESLYDYEIHKGVSQGSGIDINLSPKACIQRWSHCRYVECDQYVERRY